MQKRVITTYTIEKCYKWDNLFPQTTNKPMNASLNIKTKTHFYLKKKKNSNSEYDLKDNLYIFNVVLTNLLNIIISV